MNPSVVAPGLVLMLGLLATGCATLVDPEKESVAFHSYALPGTLDSNAVIQAVVRAFTHTLGTQPRVREGSVRSPLPAEPIRFYVTQRRLRLDHLGVVRIPQIVCPRYMAIVEAVVADPDEGFAPHRYTACIQAYTDHYSIQLVDGRMALDGRSDEPPRTTFPALSGIGRGILEQLTGARLLERGRQQADAEDGGQFAPPQATALQVASGEHSSPERGGPVSSGADRAAEQAEGPAVPSSPLACLAPRDESATIRALPGSGRVVAVLGADSLTAVAEPVDASYVRVKTARGVSGWVNRADMRQLPCPIG